MHGMSSAQLHPRVCILPSLKSFFLAQHSNASLSAHIVPPLKPQSCPTKASCSAKQHVQVGSTGFFREQLKLSTKFNDIEACVYLLQHQGRDHKLSLPDLQLRSLIQVAFARGQHAQAVALVRALPGLHPRHFSVLLKECIRTRDLVALDTVLAAREASGFRPDSYTATARISALGAAGRTTEAFQTLRQCWKRPECRTVAVVNAAIGTCAAARDWASAETTLALLRDAGLAPDVVTFNSLIKVAGSAGMMERVKLLLDELLEAGLTPTHQTYTSLFSAAAENCCQDATWLFKVFHDMALPPNDFVLSSFFSAASFAPCTPRQLDEIFTVLAAARARGPLNDITYASLFMLLTRRGIADRAVAVWRAAQQDAVLLSPHLFSTLFAACAAGQSPALLDVALDAYQELREWWASQDKRRVHRKLEEGVRVAYNSLLNFICGAGRLDETLAVFEGMKRDGPLPDAVAYNTVISAAAQAGDARVATALFKEMAGAGVIATERSFGALLHAFATVGDAAAAQTTFRALEAARIAPNEILYTSYVHALVLSGQSSALESAFEVVAEMEAHGVTPTAVTYGCLLAACGRLRDVPRAFGIYEEACAKGIRPSDAMHDILIGVCTRGGRLDDAVDLVKTMARAHAAIQECTLDSLVRALSGSSTGRALRLMGLMRAKEMHPSRATYLALVTNCSLEGEVAEALALYRTMRTLGAEVDGPAGSALISCLCQAQDVEQAMKVYGDMTMAAWRRGRLGSPAPSLRPAARSGSLRRRRRAVTKHADVPDAGALASLAQAFAARGDMPQAWRFFKQLQRKGAMGVQDACVTHRRMFEALIEGNCRSGDVEKALAVFDEWKAASTAWFVRTKEDPAKQQQQGMEVPGVVPLIPAPVPALVAPLPPSLSLKRRPKLSNVSLAFLEACCRSEGLEWRVFDVCAVMRMQTERKQQEALARPQKASHHFLGNVQTELNLLG